MFDIITKIGRSLVQHGPHNDRIYVMRLSHGDVPTITHRLYDMARENKYSKIFVKAPGYALDAFMNAGYVVEAYVPGFFNGHESGYFMAKYLDGSRAVEMKNHIVEGALSAASKIAGKWKMPSLPEGLMFHVAEPKDARDLASLYGRVFSTYPFPINDAAYICRMMEKNLRYFCVRSNGRLVAASSAEMDNDAGNVEMTDFATLQGYQGRGISAYMLHRMEENMMQEGMKLAYTIARATSYPMNRIFSRAGYSYGGRLVNNTNICGAIESMNVWYKSLGRFQPSAFP
jgi:putative beta-lysine N-acetyltransferase